MFVLVGNNWEQVFGKRVKDLRKARGWTQDELAQKLTAAGFPAKQTTITKIENGTRPTNVGEIATIAALLNTEIEVLFDRADDATPQQLQLQLTVLENQLKQVEDDRDRLLKQLALLDHEHESMLAEQRELAAALGAIGDLTADVKQVD